MKHKYLPFLFLFFFLICNNSFAQVQFSGGFHTGFNISSVTNFPQDNVQTPQPSASPWQLGTGIEDFVNLYHPINGNSEKRSNWSLSPLVGVHFQVGIGNEVGVFLRTGVEHTRKAGSFKTGDTEYPWDAFHDMIALNTIDVPILLGVKSNTGNGKVRFYGGLVQSHVTKSYQQYRKSNLGWSIPLIPVTLGTSLLFMPPKIERDNQRNFTENKASFQSVRIGFGFTKYYSNSTAVDIDISYERSVENVLIPAENKVFIEGVYFRLGATFGNFNFF